MRRYILTAAVLLIALTLLVSENQAATSSVNGAKKIHVPFGAWLSDFARLMDGGIVKKNLESLVQLNGLKDQDTIFFGDSLFVPTVLTQREAQMRINDVANRRAYRSHERWRKLAQGGQKNNGSNDGNNDGGIKKGDGSGVDVGAESNSDTSKKGITLNITGGNTQIFEGNNFYDCTFNVFTTSEPKTATKPDTTTDDSTVRNQDGFSMGAGYSYGENSKGMTVLVGQYRWGNNAAGLCFEWDPKSLNDMPWRLGCFYRRYLWRNSFTSLSPYGGSRLDANDFQSWENVAGVGAGIGYDVELGKGWILNPEYQHRREVFFLPGGHTFGHDNQIVLNLQKRFGGEK